MIENLNCSTYFHHKIYTYKLSSSNISTVHYPALLFSRWFYYSIGYKWTKNLYSDKWNDFIVNSISKYATNHKFMKINWKFMAFIRSIFNEKGIFILAMNRKNLSFSTKREHNKSFEHSSKPTLYCSVNKSTKYTPLYTVLLQPISNTNVTSIYLYNMITFDLP